MIMSTRLVHSPRAGDGLSQGYEIADKKKLKVNLFKEGNKTHCQNY